MQMLVQSKCSQMVFHNTAIGFGKSFEKDEKFKMKMEKILKYLNHFQRKNPNF